MNKALKRDEVTRSKLVAYAIPPKIWRRLSAHKALAMTLYYRRIAGTDHNTPPEAGDYL
jgi:hypothetical protein